MPVRRNQYYSGYNDPNIGKAIGSLGALFAPPDASDMAAIATAKATNDKNARLAELFTNRDAYTQDQFDRAVAATGQGNISSGYYGVNTTAATSRANNAADNARALQQTGMTQEGETLRSLFAPVAQDAARFIPPAAARKYGVPEIQQGNISVAPGETVRSASGQTYAGAPKPLNASEQEAEFLRALDPADQRRYVLRGINPTAVSDGNGGQVYAAAADTPGMAIVPDPTKMETGTAISADGKILGPAAMVGGKWVNPQNGGKPWGPEAATFSKVSVQAPTPSGLAPVKTNEQQEAAAYAYRMSEGAVHDIDQAFETGNLPDRLDSVLSGAADMAPPMARGLIRNQMSSPGQIFLQNVRTALPMQLLTQSGLGVTESEYGRKTEELVPVKGEDPQVTANKRRQFNVYLQAVRAKAGPALTNKSPGAAEATAAAATSTAPPAAPAASEERWERVNGKLQRVR